jgi:intron-binding protein aquarius
MLPPRLVAEDDPWASDPAFLAEVAVSRYERQKSQTEIVNAMPLYPTEAILWDENQVPQVHYTGARGCLHLLCALAVRPGSMLWAD